MKLIPPAVCLLLQLCLCVLPIAAQQDVVVDVRGGDDAGESPAWLNGFRTALDGATITYHSSHPDAEDALICRARRDAGSITWQSDTLPPVVAGDQYRFVWLAGIERIGWGNPQGRRTFRFFINDAEYFTFQNRKDSTASAWTITGAGGAELKFQSLFTDKFGDLFGMMFLTLPKSAFAPGFPLTFRVASEDADSPEWFMVFTYAFNFTPRVRTEPATLKSGAGAAVPLRVSLDNLVPGRRVAIADGSKRLVDTTLDVGGNIFVIPVAGDGTDRRLVYRLNGEEISADRFVARPAAPLEIYLIPHSHTDIGYTDLQPDVEKKHWKNIDVALDLIRRTRDYPAGRGSGGTSRSSGRSKRTWRMPRLRGAPNSSRR